MRKQFIPARPAGILLVFLLFTGAVEGQETQGRAFGAADSLFDVSASIDWRRGEMNAQVIYNMAIAGVKLPAGRFMAEDALAETFPRLLRPCLLPIRVNSNSTVGSMIESGELSLESLDAISRDAARIPPNVSADLTRINGRYTVFFGKISAFLTRHRQAKEPDTPLVPVPAANFTGIIIIADEELPIHGRNAKALAEPCLFPKIWDTDMNLIYDRSQNDPNVSDLMVCYTESANIFRSTPSGLDGDLAALLGSYPLRILAREVFGIYTTDLVIDRDDALKILSSDNNRRLLREGRVALVLDEKTLSAPIEPRR